MGTTKIEWAEKVWNPATGCQKISPGCKNCYAAAFAHRFWNWKFLMSWHKKHTNAKFNVRKFNEVQCHPDRLNHPAGWKKPRVIFVCSMGDLFHEDVPFNFVDDVFTVMAENTRHTYLILTKRPHRIKEYIKWRSNSGSWNYRDWPFVWFGTSIENQEAWDDRARSLRDIEVLNRFVSFEPLLGRIDMIKGRHLCMDTWLHWVIAGGENGAGSRPMHREWIKSLKMQCIDENIPFFFKGWGNWIYCTFLDHKDKFHKCVFDKGVGKWMVRVSKKNAGFHLDGQVCREYPEFKNE